jgi:hypothetical protein
VSASRKAIVGLLIVAGLSGVGIGYTKSGGPSWLVVLFAVGIIWFCIRLGRYVEKLDRRLRGLPPRTAGERDDAS